jgi:hypothetical protein
MIGYLILPSSSVSIYILFFAQTHIKIDTNFMKNNPQQYEGKYHLPLILSNFEVFPVKVYKQE